MIGPRAGDPGAAQLPARRRGSRLVARTLAVWHGPHRKHLIACGFCWTTVIAAAFAGNPDGLGGLLFVITAVTLVLIISTGPILLGARPRRIWMLVTLAGGCLLVGLMGQSLTWLVGPMAYVDVMYFGAYVLLILWLTLLSRHVGGTGDKASMLDSSAAAVGVGLALWSTILSPLVDGQELPDGLLLAVYPTVDVALLALSIHLALRLRAVPPAVKWLIGSVAYQLVIDTAHSVVRLVNPQADTAPIFALFLYWLFGLAVAATEPSLAELARQPDRRRRTPRGGRLAALLGLALSPAVLSTAIPATGLVDIVVRTVLVALLLILLVARLWLAMAALARAEADSHHRATHDGLTGLLNRAALVERLAELLSANAAAGGSTAVLFLDCDDFKHVNDTWGHPAGDTLLRDIATGLPDRLRSDDVLARQGGDEFVILATVDDLSEAVRLAERVRSFFDSPLRILPGRRHAVTASIGVTLARPGQLEEPEELLRQADLAMYEAKAGGPGRCVAFNEELARRSQTSAAVGDRLDGAVRDDAFHLELQPIMGGPGYHRLIGWEALARWHDPVLGAVPPDVFIPLAEQLGLIAELGEHVLRRACRDLARLRAVRPADDLAIYVNISPAQLLHPGFAQIVQDAVTVAGVPGRCLRLEVTETLLVDPGPVVLDSLRQVRDLGVRICLDDFGTGHSTLSTLLRLPIDCVKLDRSFTARLGVDPAAPRQVRAVIDLIDSLGIDQVVAEGVETPEQQRLLADLGAPMVQGWLHGRPATTSIVLTALRATPPLPPRSPVTPCGCSGPPVHL